MKILVIGAGIVGVCVASCLLRDGHDVILIDEREPGEGCSKGNAGALNPGSCIPQSAPGVLGNVPRWLLDPTGPLYIRPQYLPRVLPWLLRFMAAGRRRNIDPIADALRALHVRTFENYQPLVANANCKHLIRPVGTVIVYKTERSFAGSQTEWAIREARQVRQIRLDSRMLHDIVPCLSSDYHHGIHLPDNGFVADPYGLVRALADRFAVDGGTFRQARVSGFHLSDGNVHGVTLTEGRIEADRTIIAAGAWSGRLLARLGVKIPLETQRGYHVMVSAPNIQPPLPVVSADASVYATPMDQGLRFAGTVEFAGLDAAPDYRRSRALIPLAQSMFPGLEIGKVEEWMGHRPCMPDTLPVIGPLPGRQNVFLAFGHGHHGLTGASTTGVIIAALLAGRSPPVDIRPYRVDRF